MSSSANTRRLYVVILLALAVLVVLPATAHACSRPTKLWPKKKWPNGALPPLAIGDSTMILPARGLARKGFRVDAKGCRSFAQGLRLMLKYKRKHRLPHMVVIALGANWSVKTHNLRRARRILGASRIMVLVTPRERYAGDQRDAATERRYARGRPKVVLADWARFSSHRSGWFWDDPHMSTRGARRFVRFVWSRSRRYAQPRISREALQTGAGVRTQSSVV